MILPFFTVCFPAVKAQLDSISSHLTLEGIQITGHRQNSYIQPLQQIHQTYILTGKKSELIQVSRLPINFAEKSGRQLFAKIPGIFVYDMDGSGNQVNIAARGLDPHRSWEFNVRQNGVIINSDLYGYPASHYSMPMEAVQRIELIRGTAGLQYGAEFGGMLNYVIKSPDTTKAVGIESINTAGSFGLLSTFQSVGGKVKNVSYYGYYQRRHSDGYRKNSRSDAEALYLSMSFSPIRQLKLDVQLGKSKYVYQIPGPLTDSMFLADPIQSSRSRNFYSPDIWVPSIQAYWQITEKTKMHWTVSGLWGVRQSVQFEGFANKADVINPSTGQYAGRFVDIDRFASRTAEWRLLHSYTFLGKEAFLASGVRYFNNRLGRQQRGQGTNATDFDLSVAGTFGRDLVFLSKSIAAYAEQMVQINDKFRVSAGMRYEYGSSEMRGIITYLDPTEIPREILHRIPVLGISSQYQLNEKTRLYAGFSQAYRPVLFKDIIPGSVLEVTGKDLKNATGYNAELGCNGSIGQWLRFDITIFDLFYKNRMGNIVRTAQDGTSLIYKTNIGDSRTRGIEWYTEAFPYRSENHLLSVFLSASWMKSRYINSILFNGKENVDISGNQVESVPEWIIRAGTSLHIHGFQAGVQYSYVSATFSDPFNTVNPSLNGAAGIVPHYGLWDLNTSAPLVAGCSIKAGITNVLNRQYFTKRPLFYPGPGVWSSDGRGFYLTVAVKL